MENTTPSFFEKANTWIRTSIMIRLITIGILILVLLIPVSMIENLINERFARQENAVQEISDKWGKSQELKGPVLSVPYEVFERAYDKNDPSQYKLVSVTRYMHFLPENLSVKSTLAPEIRYRGIFESIIYSS